MKQKTSPSSKGNKKQGYQVWHFALAVPALAITLQVMLGSLTPLPKEHNPYTSRIAIGHSTDYNDYRHREYRHNRLPELDILPLNFRGEAPGPVLANVIKAYFPDSTAQHATDLRDTMPPCDDPRMIVILPKEEDKPVF